MRRVVLLLWYGTCRSAWKPTYSICTYVRVCTFGVYTRMACDALYSIVCVRTSIFSVDSGIRNILQLFIMRVNRASE